jgi:GT2 family glycosyltransferase
VSGSKLGLSEGYGYLREGKLPVAMSRFVQALGAAGPLASVVTANIRQTRRYYAKQAREHGDVSLVIVSQPKVGGRSQRASGPQQGFNETIELSDDGILFQGSTYSFSAQNLGNALAAFAAQHPATHVYDTVGRPASLLLALMYRLLWRTKATVSYSSSSRVRVEDFLEHQTDPQTLAQIATSLAGASLALIKHLGQPAIATQQHQNQPQAVTWPRKFTRLGELHQVLIQGTDSQFLIALFDTAFGRAPQQYERDHYLSELAAGSVTRASLAQTICAGPEAQRHLADNLKRRKADHAVYSHPGPGDLHPDEIELPHHPNPKVSVLIPVYEKVEYTLACLKSIADHLPKASFEVIVMDDQSPDGSAKLLQQVKNVRVIVNPQNMGFLRSCNNGTRHAKGEYLFFLNNDTQVKPGWLDELLLTFTNFPNCGLAGSKLIYPDGLLQEAGGIVWQDGSAWNYGNRQDPKLPQFNYAREVDYVSGAAIMVPTKLYEELGGFDELYAPAYYEDTDLALRIRAQGKSVIYQPMSEVVHFEGISSGTDTSTGIKAYQVINREKFLQRWKARLQQHRRNGVEPHLERDRGAKGRVLFIDACTPTPDQDSGSIDIYNLMKVFVEMGWAVSFIPEDNYAYMEKYTPAIQKLGVQALYHPHINTVDDHITPYGGSYDLVMSFRPMVTRRHIDNLRQKCPAAKIVYNTVDLHFLRLDREAKLKNDAAIAQEGLKLKAIELELMKQADLTTVVSSSELETLQKMGVERVVHLPFSREIHPSNVPFEARSGIIFVGGFQHNPNVDAVQYFVTDIMPLLREMIPGVVLHLVGSNTPRVIEIMACEDIVVHGFIEDLEELMSGIRVNVAPLRYGAGTKGKVVHAMSIGVPTVATPIASEGMNLRHLSEILIANDSESFANMIKEVYENKKLWNDLSSKGLMLAQRLFGLNSIREKVRRLLV